MRTLLLVVMLCILVSGDTKNSQYTPKENERSEVTNETFAKTISDNYYSDIEHPFREFCDKYQEIAILYQIKYGVPVSIQFAQAIAESGAGKSEIAKKANNLFGMKYYKKLYEGGYYQTSSGTKWRKYNTFEESFLDHALFLNKFYYYAVGKNWTYWINHCRGYGEGQYWKHIGEIVKRYKLYEYDRVVDFSIKINKTYNL